ncbi:DUF3108 domain-containing protein [Limnohabitans sp. Rim8]|uniref:DUF3108 domain-containing protein n=1 Tax=Limnohabitans sp. Rim8 TaxID=1100718 RepID=UPI00330596EE
MTLSASMPSGPSRKTLLLTIGLVLLVHLSLLLGGPEALQLSLRAEPAKTLPFQTRMMQAQAPNPVALKPSVAAKPRRSVTAPSSLPSPSPASTTEPLEPQFTAPTDTLTTAPTETATTPASTDTPTPAQAEVATPAVEPLQPITPPPVPLAVGALPPSTLLQYNLIGQDRGLTYYANGELRWQHNPTDYEASLTIKAFLLGSRVYSSVGSVGANGLIPTRYADKWRGERATHFDAENKRIVFSNNKPSAELLLGAQDQVSLFVQLAAAMTGDPERYKPDTSVSIQTATVNEAVPWTLTMQAEETLQIDEKPVPTSKWVCLPRGKYDTKVELWLSRHHAWMPVRIRITQVSGSFIDMSLDKLQPLAPLPAKRTENN